MKKYLLYISILVTLVGVIAFVPTKQARADNYEPLGTCTFDVGPAIHWTQNTCYDNDPSGTDWNEDTGTCILQNWSYKSCVTDKMPNPGAFVGANTNPTTNGQCTFSNWTDTSCHQNGPGAFTPVFSGTTPLAGALPVGTCSVTHISTSGCQKVSGTLSSTLTDTVTAGSGGTCSVAATQAKCATYGGGFWNTIGGSWGGVPVATWYGPGVTPATPGTVGPMSMTYTLLAPLPNPSGGAQMTTFDPTSTTALSDYLNIMIKIFIGICAVLAVVMTLMGGIEYMTSELVSSKEAGKERIRDAIFGLILALGAWLLLNTINPNLLKVDFSSLTQVAADADINSDVPQTPTNGKYVNGGVQGGAWNDQTAGPIATLPSGVSVYNSQCTTIGQTGCTSTRGLSLSYISTILSNCPSCAPLSIQGGTEYWLHGGHSGSTSHGVGSPTVDLGVNQSLTNWIMTGNPSTQASAPAYFTRHSQAGISFLWENNHWHAGS